MQVSFPPFISQIVECLIFKTSLFKTQISNKFWAGAADRPIKMVADQQYNERALLVAFALRGLCKWKIEQVFYKWAVSTTIDYINTQI